MLQKIGWITLDENKEENRDAAWAKAIVDAYHSEEFKQYMKENNDGLWWVPEELQ